MKSLSIKTKLIFSYMVLAGIIIFASGTGMYLVNNIVDVLNKVTDEAAPIVESVDDLIINLWESNKVAEEILADEEISNVKKLAAEFDVLDNQFDQAYIEVKKLVTDEDLKDEVKNADKEQEEFGTHTREMIKSRLIELEELITVKKKLIEFDNKGATLQTMLSEFSDENEAEMAKAEEEGDRLEKAGTATAADVNKILGELFDSDYPVVEAALKLRTLVMELQDTAGEFTSEKSVEKIPEIRKNFVEIFAKTKPHIAILTKLAETDEDKQDAVDLIKVLAEWKGLALDGGQLFSIYEGHLTSESQSDQLTELLETDADNAAKYLDVIASKADEIAAGADDIGIVKHAGKILLLVAGIGLMFAVSLGFLMARMITKPINSVVAGLKDAAEGEGDLTKRLEVNSTDEVGELAKWFNLFIEKLQGSIKEIRGGVDTLSSSSTELSAVSEQMNQGVQNVSDKSNTVSAASEEMNANMNNVAAAMEQSATNVNMVATASEEMSSTIDEIAKNAEKARGISSEAAQKASSASTNMEQLGTAANSIGKVIETITDISEQVNLLSLNATIESARAGEAGKGFAVVANEIKELAKQTAAATQDIKKKIEDIQGTTSTTVTQIIEITDIIDDVNEVVSSIATAVEQQSAATREIATNVGQASEGIREVNVNVNQSSTVSGEISKDIADVNLSMKEMSFGSSQVNTSAQELSKLSENLKRIVEQFKV